MTVLAGYKSAVKVTVKDTVHNVDFAEWPSLMESQHSTSWHAEHCVLPSKTDGIGA